jgi:hypothetical protein
VRDLEPIDISHYPELRRLVDEVRGSNSPRVLRRGNEDVAILIPMTRWRSTRKRRQPDYEAFRSAAGGWKDVDTDKLIADIYADRMLDDRPPVQL